MTYGKRTLIAVDQLINTLLGGWPDETLSSRCYRWARAGLRLPCNRGGRAIARSISKGHGIRTSIRIGAG